MKRRPIGPSHEGRVFLYVIAAAAPAALAALGLLWVGDFSPKVRWTLTVLVAGTAFGFAAAARERVMRPLQTLANLLAALREDDFSIRGRHSRTDDALGAAMAEVNALGDVLRAQRLGAVEAAALLRKVLEAIDVAIFAFDEGGVLRLVNRAGERLHGGALLGQPALALGMSELLEGEAPRTTTLSVGGAAARGPWLLRRASARLGGRPHTLVVLTDVGRALREEERLAWQRLVRVLGHEINNSLTPIQSLAGSLRAPNMSEEDRERGLTVIERRAESLGRFMTSYARLAGLPRPRLGSVDVAAWVRRNVELEKRSPVRIAAGPTVSVAGDGDQLDQLLINILRNAVDATLESGGEEVVVSWVVEDGVVDVVVEDDGPGIGDTGNLFVPFFTTKPQGSGIGLPLSRQIAEAHGGSLELHNRKGRRGCAAHIRLPR